MAFNIGVNVLEVEGTAAPSVVAAPVSTAGFLVGSERGVPNVPVLVRSFSDFVTYFGSYRSGLFGAHAVNGFFQNGGAEARIVRIVGTATPATATLNASGGGPALGVRSGMLGRDDPGTWGNSLSVRVDDSPQATTQLPAQIVAANVEPFALVDNSGVYVTVYEAASPVAVRFHTADFVDIAHATAAEVAAVIDRASQSLRAGATPGHHLLIASTTASTASHLAVAAPGGGVTDASTALGLTGADADSDQGITVANSTIAAVESPAGFEPGAAALIQTRGHVVAPNPIGAPPAFPAGIDVTVDGGAAVQVRFAATDFAGAPTPAEILAAIRRQAAGLSVDQTATGTLALMSNTWGTGSTIAIAAPAGPTTDANGWLGFTGAAPTAGTEASDIVATIDEAGRMVTWTAALAAALDPRFARIRTLEFKLSVLRAGSTAPLEAWDGLSMQENVPNYAPTVLNDADAGSRYVTLSDPNAGAPGVKDDPAPGTTSLGGGAETAPTDAAWVGSSASRTGLYAFDTVRIQLLACPETQSAGVVTAALTYCQNRGDSMFVGTAPRGYDRDGIKTYAGPFRAKKVYGAMYSPWIKIANPLDTTGVSPQLFVPPDGHVLGVYARMAAVNGVWRAPAGDDAVLNLALGVEFPMTDADLTDLVETGSVNGIRAVPGSGIVIDSSRTLSTETRWRYVNVRRLFNFVKASLGDSLRFVAQEPHDQALRNRVKFNVVMPFLLGLWSQGAFGSDPANQVFTIKCDASNNPPAQVQQGYFTLEVYFYPVKPAEKIIITVAQQPSGATTSEA